MARKAKKVAKPAAKASRKAAPVVKPEAAPAQPAATTVTKEIERRFKRGPVKKANGR